MLYFDFGLRLGRQRLPELFHRYGERLRRKVDHRPGEGHIDIVPVDSFLICSSSRRIRCSP